MTTLGEHLAHQKAMQDAYDRVADRMSRTRLEEMKRRTEIELREDREYDHSIQESD